MTKPLDFQNFPFPMVGGLDTKVDGVALPAPKLQVCQNAYADKSGSLKKRAGNLQLTSNLVSGSAIGTPIALATYKDNQLAFSNNNAYEYGSTAACWIDKGTAYSFRVRTENVNYGTSARKPISVDMATAGSVTVYASVNSVPSGANITTTVLVTVVDADGTVYKSEKQLYTVTNVAGEVNAVRCIALGTRIYVLYYDSSVTSLMCWILDTTSAASINTGLNASAAVLANDINTTTPVFDVAVGTLSTQPCVVYRNTAGGVGALKMGFITTAGALVTTTTHATVAGAKGVNVCINATTTHGFVYTATTTPSDLYATIKTFSSGVWINVVTSAAIELGSLGVVLFPNGTGCLWETATSMRIWYSGNGSGGNTQTYQATYTTGGTATARVQTLRHGTLAAKPFTGTDGNFYYWAFSGPVLSVVQPTLYLMRHDNIVTAWANQSVAFWPALVGWTSSVISSGSTFTTMTGFLAKIGTQSGSYVGSDSQIGMRTIAVDMTHAQSHKTVEVGDSLYMAGGFLQTYDGHSFVESDFLKIANGEGTTGEAITIASSSSGGTLTAGAQYSYMVVPEWTNMHGERQRGANDGAISATVGVAPDNALTLTIPCTPYTLKKSPRANMVWAVYRTGPNPDADAEFHRCGAVENDPTANTVTFLDTDGDVTDQEPFYQDGGVLENLAPPSGYILAQGGSRVFVAGLSDDKHQIVASKIRETGEPVSFNDTLIIQVPELGGAITALEYLDEQLVIFKESRIYVLPRGGGPNGETGLNNLGVGVFLIPELVTGTDTGCTGQRSVLSTPMGLTFQGVKGLMLLDQGRQVQYFGSALEGLSVGTVTGAAILPTFQQLRFATSAATYVFDYYHKIWSVYTMTSAAVTLAQSGKYVTIGSGSFSGVLMEDTATFTDASTAFLMKVRLAWVASQSARQGALRFRWVGLVATPSAEATVRIQVSVNFLSTVTQTFNAIYTAGELNSPARRQVRLNAATQVASALQIELDDQSATNASVTLNEIDFNMATRKNFDRLLGGDS